MKQANQAHQTDEHLTSDLGKDPEVKDIEELAMIAEAENLGRSRWLLLLLAILLILLVSVSLLFYRYLRQPAPLPELVAPQAGINYPPHYLFSIYGLKKPVGVTLSPIGDRIYVAESGGQRQVQIFDREGNPLGAFTAPDTTTGERAPVYLSTDASGNVYLSDRLQHAVLIFDRDGNFLDAILSANLTLSEYIHQQTGENVSGARLAYNIFRPEISFQTPSGEVKRLPHPDPVDWAPLGVRLDQEGVMYLTDVDKDNNRVKEIWLKITPSQPPWNNFEPSLEEYGESGADSGQFMFPNSAMPDSQGRVYVSDGNNGRIAVWDANGNFLFNFGSGTGDGGVSLPRGLFIDQRDRLHVVDAVGQNIKVYDVSRPEPTFLYAFGDLGVEAGLFNFPNDIVLDDSGRLYIADRENNRVQVWSY